MLSQLCKKYSTSYFGLLVSNKNLRGLCSYKHELSSSSVFAMIEAVIVPLIRCCLLLSDSIKVKDARKCEKARITHLCDPMIASKHFRSNECQLCKEENTQISKDKLIVKFKHTSKSPGTQAFVRACVEDQNE